MSITPRPICSANSKGSVQAGVVETLYRLSQRLLLIIMDFENFDQTRELQNFACAFAQSHQGKAHSRVPRSLQSFNQRGYARTIDVAHANEIDDHAWRTLFFQFTQQHF